ncbi:MAG: cupin domain-containing protein [Okeania sp. SIO3C4]|nr:cupin domain-containing protein [Okeania sp. SIO3B3]NER05196.1 cupin domain-containing protein [Okeania sp. SIO3C4]
MTTFLLSPESPFIQLKDQIEYSTSGIISKAIVKDDACQYSLFCLAAQTEITEHTSTRNATIYVIEGNGSLTLNGKAIPLEPGQFIFMPANAPHALSAVSNLSFILILSSTT